MMISSLLVSRSWPARCALLLASIALGACTAGDDGDVGAEQADTTSAPLVITPINVFSYDAYENALRDALDGAGAIGYSYAMYQNGSLKRSGAAGMARLQPAMSWTADVPYETMSMGKTITAAAYVKLLAQKGISLDAKVAPYVPFTWSKDADFDPTFRQVLSHTAGFTTGVDPWSGVKTQVASGVLPPGSFVLEYPVTTIPAGQGTFYYSNTNFTLARVMMGYVIDKPTAMAQEILGNGPSWTAWTYRDWVLGNIFGKIGLWTSSVDAQPVGTQPGTYNEDGSEVHFDPTDGSTVLDSGAGYWSISMKNYAKFLDALVNGKFDVVDSSGKVTKIWTEMTTMASATNTSRVGLGLFRAPGNKGNYYTHSGGWSKGNVGSCGRWMVYPNGVSVVWIMNSAKKDADGKTVCPVSNGQQMMVDAYDNAWAF